MDIAGAIELYRIAKGAKKFAALSPQILFPNAPSRRPALGKLGRNPAL